MADFQAIQNLVDEQRRISDERYAEQQLVNGELRRENNALRNEVNSVKNENKTLRDQVKALEDELKPGWIDWLKGIVAGALGVDVAHRILMWNGAKVCQFICAKTGSIILTWSVVGLLAFGVGHQINSYLTWYQHGYKESFKPVSATVCTSVISTIKDLLNWLGRTFGLLPPAILTPVGA